MAQKQHSSDGGKICHLPNLVLSSKYIHHCSFSSKTTVPILVVVVISGSIYGVPLVQQTGHEYSPSKIEIPFSIPILYDYPVNPDKKADITKLGK